MRPSGALLLVAADVNHQGAASSSDRVSDGEYLRGSSALRD